MLFRSLEKKGKRKKEKGKEKKLLESEMSSGSMDHSAILAAGKRMEEIINEIDEAEFRLLELMEKES